MKRAKLILIILAIGVVGLGLYAGLKGGLKPTLDTDQSVTDASWATFETYIAAAKAQDVDKLSSVAYKLSSTCQDKSKKMECGSLIQGVVDYAGDWKKEDFKHILWDKKQVILFTDWDKVDVTIEKTPIVGYERREIYLTRGRGGSYKILHLTLPSTGVYLVKDDELSPAEKEARLQTLITDTDKDAIDNELEQCINVGPGCVQTDPNKRDSNGNGWWDGVERYINGTANSGMRKPPVSAASTTETLTKPFESLSLPL